MGFGVVIDIVILGVCALFAIRGFLQGFVHEVLSLLAFVAGYFAALLLNEKMSVWLQGSIGVSDTIGIAISSVVLFVVAYIAVRFIEVQLTRFVNLIMLSSLNRISGLLIGTAKGVVIILILVYAIRVQPIFPNVTESMQLSTSKILPYLESFYQQIVEMLHV